MRENSIHPNGWHEELYGYLLPADLRGSDGRRRRASGEVLISQSLDGDALGKKYIMRLRCWSYIIYIIFVISRKKKRVIIYMPLYLPSFLGVWLVSTTSPWINARLGRLRVVWHVTGRHQSTGFPARLSRPIELVNVKPSQLFNWEAPPFVYYYYYQWYVDKHIIYIYTHTFYVYIYMCIYVSR